MTTDQKLYQLYVPIPNYYNDGIFMQEMFIIADRCPLEEIWLNLAIEYHERDKEYPEYTGDWEQVIKAIERAISNSQFPFLFPNMTSTNGFIKTAFEKQPITLSRPYVKVID